MPNPLYIDIYIYRIWFGLVLWHRNNSKLFNAKSSLYIYIYIYIYILNLVWFGLVLWHINLCRLYSPKFQVKSYGLVTYPRHSLSRGSYSSIYIQSVYLTVQQDTGWRSLRPLHGCCRCIQQPQSTGPWDTFWWSRWVGDLTLLQICCRCIQQPQSTGPWDTF